MSDKDQFTFEDEDDFPKTALDDTNEPQESELSFEDEGDFPKTALDDTNEPQESELSFEGEDDFPKTDLDDTNQLQESNLSFEDSPAASISDQEEPQELDLIYAGSSEPSLSGQDESPEVDLNYEDDFPETDLSAAFSEGEHAAEESDLDESEPKVEGGGSSKTRLLLMVLLLVIVGGGGAYYFMGLGETTPSVPTVAVPVQKTTKTVALPSKPATAPAAPAVVEPAAKPVTVAVPPPPAQPAPKVAPVKQPVTANTPPPPVKKPAEKAVAEKPKVETAKQPAIQVAVPLPESKAKPVEAKPTTSAPAPASQKVVVATPPAATPAESTKTAAPSKQVAGGAFALDAGSYLLESNRASLVAKIKNLGYEPLVTPVDATLDMTRLRLGTFGKDEVKEALDLARSIEPGAYSAPAGDGYVVYAGTFLKSRSVDKLSQRFLKEGIKVHPEPVQVVRTLSRIRFGSFATKADAAAVASELSQSGLKATVVKSKE